MDKIQRREDEEVLNGASSLYGDKNKFVKRKLKVKIIFRKSIKDVFENWLYKLFSTFS